jgi:hypothetical protein
MAQFEIECVESKNDTAREQYAALRSRSRYNGG